MRPELLQTLMKKQLEGAISDEEQELLQRYVQDEQHKEAVVEALGSLLAQQQPDNAYDAERFEHLLQEVLQADKPEIVPAPVRRILFRWVAVAAVLIVAAGAALFFLYYNKQVPVEKTVVSAPANDALPGQEGAILILANGNRIVLDSSKTGVVNEQGMRAVIKDGTLVYEPVAGNGTLSYNTMTTPRGRQFKLVLPDGSAAWLNAASSITYPVQFIGATRPVSITGEVYFEVAKDAEHPFLVTVNNNVQVEVLGTHFNVNAYEDGNGITTTLLEGSVKINSNAGNGVLKPGEQVIVNNGSLKRNSNADTEAVMAWKEGRFSFNNTSFAQVMGELQRWYDVDVVYESAVPSGALSGDFSRTLLLSEVLRILELSGIHYKIENKKLIVSAR
ncbi:MAG: DUF4974 domain-containing protein [Chitinophagaceae bacterium]